MAEVIYDKEIHDVLPSRFLDYAVAVLKDRAIPDCADGLKPIHRRVLMAMHDLGLTSKVPYRKCAKTIGEVLGKYHPHGDQSAYDALVGLAQDFNMRYPLIDGSGNFGSVNDDPAAAMRYTEARLSPFGELMLEDVDKLSPMKDNFDGSAKEPVVLSTYFPNLLLNPTNGIAVGLVSKFAPHYAKDVYTALMRALELEVKGEEISLDELVSIIKAPDFPTGAQIINASAMKEMYATGKGGVILRAKYRIEGDSIVYYEIPYKITPKSIIEDIVKLGIPDIKDVRNESSLKAGMRIVVEMKRGTVPDFIISRLFKDTKLQSNYFVNMVSIEEGAPRVNMSLKDVVSAYIKGLKKSHRRSLDVRAKELEQKLFVVNTMLKAISMIDEIIRIVRNENKPVEFMQEKLGFTKEEAEYIYEMRISSLSRASKDDLDIKHAEYTGRLATIQGILADNKKFLKDISAKLKAIRDGKLFKDDVRRTEVLDVALDDTGDIKSQVKNEPVVVTYSTKSLVKVSRPSDYRLMTRNRVGQKSKLREDEYIVQVMSMTTHDDLILFSDYGKCYILPVCKIGIMSRSQSGRNVRNFLQLDSDENIIFVRPLMQETESGIVTMVTRNGVIKRVAVAELRKARTAQQGTKAILLDDGDTVAGVSISGDDADVAIFTTWGRGILFGVKEVRVMYKQSRGMNALKLQDGEYVFMATTVAEDSSIYLITDTGLGRKLSRSTLKRQKRTQAPLIYMDRNSGTAIAGVVEADSADAGRNILITTAKGQNVVIRPDDFKETTRQAKGLKMINLKDDSVVGMTVVEDSFGDGELVEE